MRLFFLLLFTSFIMAAGSSQTLLVKPFLQDATPTSMYIMWETSAGVESKVQYGTASLFEHTAYGTSRTTINNTQVHSVQLTGLQPSTKYFYMTITDALVSEAYFFVTPPLPSSEKSFTIIAMSDMQQDSDHPTVFSDIVNDNLLPYMASNYPNDLATDLAFVFLPGDLVADGTIYNSWATTFFQPAENLFSYVPVYTVLGNHDKNATAYFDYFQLPDNGTHAADYPEHWWYKDYSNVRLIGLDSDPDYRVQAQLDWLATVLDDACDDENIDFVFAELHHPYHSELWIDGNTEYTGQIIELMGDFSTSCGKPSAHFFGHTHGYSRGQSRDYTHLMVNVATAGGAIDNWGEFEQQDYPEFVRSDDDYGFVVIDIQAGDDPQFLLKRISHGSYENGLVTNVLKDSIRIRLHNHPPSTPICIFPEEDMTVTPDCIIFKCSPYQDDDGDKQGGVQWQVATDADFTNIVTDQWKNRENLYFNVDLQAWDNLDDEKVTVLSENTTYYWRVRQRDIGLAWSDWSPTTLFHTSASQSTPNLLLNPGAEFGTTIWIEDAGSFESILSGDCDGNTAHTGDRLFAVGGICEENVYGEGHQDIDVSNYATDIAAGTVNIRFGGFLSDYNGYDRPEFKLELYDADGNLLHTTPTYGIHNSVWTHFLQIIPAPTNLATIRMILMGTLNAGQDNDSYFDDMFVRLNLNASGCEELVGVPVATSDSAQLLLISPNPTQQSVTIQPANRYEETYAIRIYDQMGRLVVSKNKEQAERLTLDIGALPGGIYHVHAFGGLRDYGWGRLVVTR